MQGRRIPIRSGSARLLAVLIVGRPLADRRPVPDSVHRGLSPSSPCPRPAPSREDQRGIRYRESRQLGRLVGQQDRPGSDDDRIAGLGILVDGQPVGGCEPVARARPVPCARFRRGLAVAERQTDHQAHHR